MFHACAFLSFLPMAASAQAPAPIEVKLGVSDLLTMPTGTVGYQRFGEASHVLGYLWQGFDDASGVYFVPETGDDGRAQVFMHCPWRGGTGASFFDMRLKLPNAKPIRLAFEIALRATARGSDGVTYRVLAEGRELFSEFCTARKWEAHEADLSAYAGQVITLRLEVGPGPAKDPTDDWSLWGKAEILAGTDQQLAAARETRRQEQLAEARRLAERAAVEAAVSLARATSHEPKSVRPSLLEACRDSLRQEKGLYAFECRAPSETVTFRLDAAKGVPAGLSVEVDGKPITPTPFAGGPLVCFGERTLQTGAAEMEAALASAEVEGGAVALRYRFTDRASGQRAVLALRLSAEGKSLLVEAHREEGAFAGFNWRLERAQPMWATFAPATVGRIAGSDRYVSVVTDWTVTDATVADGAGSRYAPLTGGRRNDLNDLFYLTVSRRYVEVLPNTPNRPSPFLDELSRRVVLDMWDGSFAAHEQWLKDMARYGVTSCLIINHVWQRDGYDHTYPNTMPANAALGGDAGLKSLAQTALALGHRFNVHENYYDYYPNAEAFRAEDCALDPQGQRLLGWDNGQVRACILKPTRLMAYVREFTPQIKERYGCNSAYHDIMPTWLVDYDGRAPDAGKIRVTRAISRELFDYNRALFGGPVVCEAVHSEMSGQFDGGCNHGVDNYRTPTAVAFELLKVHPLMSNHGFGYYERWLPWGYGPGWNTYVMTERERDRYRATQVAFGRTGFIGQQLMQSPPAVVKEYYLMQAFARAYTGKLVSRLRYATKDGAWLDAGAAATLGELGRLEVEYEDNQRVWVNLAEEPWIVGGMVLPAGSCATNGPRAIAYTALLADHRADFAAYEGVVYADARSDTYLPPPAPRNLRPSVASLKWAGERQFDLQMQWNVERVPERDYTVFVHFVDPKRGGIAFQTDHAPPQPPSTWQPGRVVADHVVRVTIPEKADADEYDIVTGLYDHEGRAPLVAGATAMRVGRLLVRREAARLVGVDFEPAGPQPWERLSDPAPYLEGLNAERKVLDFGEVATNGAVILRRTAAGRELIPVPLGAEFDVGLAGGRLTVIPVTRDGARLPPAAIEQRGGKAWFRTARDALRYELSR